ncbi:MAG: M50 family metallopeptidase [Acidobacteriaceae bacterium]|nr:M50 family metallopeptidase [Acidobacteriaceae bacterium]
MNAAFEDHVDPPLPRWPVTFSDARVKPNSSWHLLPAALAIGIAMNVLLPSWAGVLSSSVRLGNVWELSALIAALVCAIVLHEGGHLAAALLMEFEILGGSIGPFRVNRMHGEWIIQFSVRRLFSGSISAVPRTDECWRKRMLFVVAAGPAATFLTGLLAMLLLLLNPNEGWINSFFGALTQFSFFLFVLGLIPNSAEAQVRNDARLFISLCHNTPDAEEILLYHLVTQLSLTGFRPRDYPERLIRRIAIARSRPDASSVYAHTIVLWATDRGDLTTAVAWNCRMLELADCCEPRLRNLMRARSACFRLLLDDDISAVKSSFAEVNCEMLSPGWFMHKAKAARSLALGNTSEALAEVSRARFAFPKRLPYYEFERMLLSQIHRKALAARSAALPVSQASCAA